MKVYQPLRTISEDIVTITGANATVEHNFSNSAIWYHTGVSGNFTVNLTNVPTTQNKAYSIALIVNQGGTGYLPNSFAVNSASPLTINWSNGLVPNTNANKIDIVAFSIVNVSARLLYTVSYHPSGDTDLINNFNNGVK